MIVAALWFVATNAAVDRQTERERQRMGELVALHEAELTAARIGTWVESMVAATHGFLASGREDLLVPYFAADRAFRSDIQVLARRSDAAGRLESHLGELRRLVEDWQSTVVGPNIESRRARGGAPAADAVQRMVNGMAMLDTARAAHILVRRDLRDQVVTLEAEMERASAYDDLELFVIFIGAVLIFLLLGTLMLRVVNRALQQGIRSAAALEAGRYAEARLPAAHASPNREMALLARSFEQLADGIEARERQLQRDIVKLTELERLKTDFVSTVSHELRTPLTSMRGALGLMLGGKVGEISGRGRDLLQIATSNTERLIRLINDILDIEKMDAGHVSVRHDRLKVRTLVETTLAGLEGLARDAGVTLRLRGRDDGAIIGDSDRMIQVFTNLASNAIKFSPRDACVDLSIEPSAGSVTVRVRDRGPGISPEFAERIFGRFQQAGGAESRKSGGTGLGLNIAKSIVELHGGTIGFEPAVDGGTCFWVTLPRVEEVTAEMDARYAVLVVEDDASMRDVLVAQLDGIARPIAVASAEAALEVLASEEVAAIILDPGLPGMNGLDFARGLRSDPKLRTMPVFLYTASEHDPELLRKSGIRATDAFVKTRDSEELLFDRLRATLRSKR